MVPGFVAIEKQYSKERIAKINVFLFALIVIEIMVGSSLEREVYQMKGEAAGKCN
jgi:hypothetical protein